MCPSYFPRKEGSVKLWRWGHIVRALIDTASEISVLNSREMKLLRMDKAQIKSRNMEVTQEISREMEILGKVDLPVGIGNLKTHHGIYISPTLCRKLIIEGERLKGIMQYFTLNLLS